MVAVRFLLEGMDFALVLLYMLTDGSRWKNKTIIVLQEDLR